MYGRELAGRFGATLHVLHVVQDISSAPCRRELRRTRARVCNSRLKTAREGGLDSVGRRQRHEGPATVKAMVTSSSPAPSIVDYARDHNIDIIVIGTHGRGALAHLHDGSVAERVVRLRPCPVLTVHHPEREFVRPDSVSAVTHASLGMRRMHVKVQLATCSRARIARFAHFIRRLIGAAMLDVSTFEEVEADRSATPQALAIVVGSSPRPLSAPAAWWRWRNNRAVLDGRHNCSDTWVAFALMTFEIGPASCQPPKPASMPASSSEPWDLQPRRDSFRSSVCSLEQPFRYYVRDGVGTRSKRRGRETGPRLHQHRPCPRGLRPGLVPRAGDRDGAGRGVRP